MVVAFPPSRLGGLYLGENHVSDEGLKRIGRMTNISVLELGPRPNFPKAPAPVAGKGARITDEGLLALKPLSKIHMLGLQGTPIGDAGLENLRGVGRDLNGQLGLSLAGTQVTDTGLARLPDLFPNLGWLELDGCAITDAGLAHLGRLKRLWHLSLNDTPVGDAGLRHLANLPALHRLQLDRTQVTDQGLASLEVMKGPLGDVTLQGTGVTAAKKAELRTARPKTRIR
jgi:internalin A